MPATQFRCHGCGRLFALHGLSHHISKTQDPRCRNLLETSRVKTGFTTIQPTATPPPLDYNDAVPVSEDGEYSGPDYDGEGSDDHDRDDPADLADADALQELGSSDIMDVSTHDQSIADETPLDLTPPQPSQTEVGDRVDVDSESESAVEVQRFPLGSPGAPIAGRLPEHDSQAALFDSPWAPFHSRLEWDVACWAKLRGGSSTAVSELLAIPGVVDALGLSFHTVNKLNEIVDSKLPGRPSFQRKEFKVGNEEFEFYFRDAMQCIRALYGDPRFAEHLVFAPERHYTDPERSCRIYNEMHTGNWWWMVQESLEHRRPGATIIPLIVSTDKTQLTPFRDKMAYPIYLTIGNIPKQIRRKVSCHAQILLGYIPTTKLASLPGVTARRRALANMFHACMQIALGPITSYGETGVEMKCGNGVWRRCHPILANFVGDYPEQALVTCTHNGRCSKCKVPRGQLGEYETFPRRVQSTVIEAYQLCDADALTFNQACREAEVKPVYYPFWASLPLVDIFLSITPDILHQLLQGMVKHLVAWLRSIFGAAAIDARCRLIPPNHKVVLFTKGITTLSRVSGQEHKNMCSILLGLVVDLPIPGGLDSTRVIRAVRALMDFLFLARLEAHTGNTLLLLQESLATFHENKQVFIDLEARENFNLPKLHSLTHYASSIRLFGSTDNYNTEQTERLHIDLAKDAYRATNRKGVYSQMTKWLERQEKLHLHSAFMTQRQGLLSQPRSPSKIHIGPPRASPQKVQMAQNPRRRLVNFDSLARDYGALDFQDTLAEFIAQVNHPRASGGAQQNRAHNTHIPFTRVPVYHKIKFTTTDDLDPEIVDVVHVRPEQKDSHGRIIPARFDTALVETSKGRRIAQVRVVFQIPPKEIDVLFPSQDKTPNHLAYVEWFTPIPETREPKHLMYKVSRVVREQRRSASIIPVESILSSVHLLPRFGAVPRVDLNTFTILDQSQSFYINPFTSTYDYLIFGR